MTAFMTLTRADVDHDHEEKVLVNPQHITEVRVKRLEKRKDFDDRALLSLTLQGGGTLTVLALDENRKPIPQEKAYTVDRGRLLLQFNQAVRAVS
ncbi:hypothetical protein GCM10009592_30270 [Brachybacterium rhamnosum]|uniref:Uncharacterized protein n=1 Tax=Brachybacterium rhamnosum TaxID=173361 RepID=A0ABW4Q1A4_9MICO